MYASLDNHIREYLLYTLICAHAHLGHMPDAPVYERDLRARDARIEEARKILTQKGYTKDSPLTLKAAYTSYQTEFFFPVIEMIEDGLPIQIDTTAFDLSSEYYRTIYSSDSTDFDITPMDWGRFLAWPYYYISFYFNENTVPQSFRDKARELFHTMRTSSDPVEVNAAERAAIEMLNKSNMYIPILSEGAFTLVNNKIENRSGEYSVWINDFAEIGKESCQD